MGNLRYRHLSRKSGEDSKSWQKKAKNNVLTAVNFIWMSLVSFGCLAEILLVFVIGGVFAVPVLIYQAIKGDVDIFKKCIHCKERIKKEATKCPKCGGWQNQSQEKE